MLVARLLAETPNLIEAARIVLMQCDMAPRQIDCWIAGLAAGTARQSRERRDRLAAVQRRLQAALKDEANETLESFSTRKVFRAACKGFLSSRVMETEFPGFFDLPIYSACMVTYDELVKDATHHEVATAFAQYIATSIVWACSVRVRLVSVTPRVVEDRTVLEQDDAQAHFDTWLKLLGRGLHVCVALTTYVHRMVPGYRCCPGAFTDHAPLDNGFRVLVEALPDILTTLDNARESLVFGSPACGVMPHTLSIKTCVDCWRLQTPIRPAALPEPAFDVAEYVASLNDTESLRLAVLPQVLAHVAGMEWHTNGDIQTLVALSAVVKPSTAVENVARSVLKFRAGQELNGHDWFVLESLPAELATTMCPKLGDALCTRNANPERMLITWMENSNSVVDEPPVEVEAALHRLLAVNKNCGALLARLETHSEFFRVVLLARPHNGMALAGTLLRDAIVTARRGGDVFEDVLDRCGDLSDALRAVLQTHSVFAAAPILELGNGTQIDPTTDAVVPDPLPPLPVNAAYVLLPNTRAIVIRDEAQVLEILLWGTRALRTCVPALHDRVRLMQPCAKRLATAGATYDAFVEATHTVLERCAEQVAFCTCSGHAAPADGAKLLSAIGNWIVEEVSGGVDGPVLCFCVTYSFTADAACVETVYTPARVPLYATVDAVRELFGWSYVINSHGAVAAESADGLMTVKLAPVLPPRAFRITDDPPFEMPTVPGVGGVYAYVYDYVTHGPALRVRDTGGRFVVKMPHAYGVVIPDPPEGWAYAGDPTDSQLLLVRVTHAGEAMMDMRRIAIDANHAAPVSVFTGAGWRLETHPMTLQQFWFHDAARLQAPFVDERHSEQLPQPC